MDKYNDYDCPAKETSSISGTRPRPRYSIGNEPDPFVVYFTVSLREKCFRNLSRSPLRPADLAKILGGRPKSTTFNFVNDMVVQIENKEQSAILSRTKYIGEFEVEVTPHLELNNVTGVIESKLLWKERSDQKVVRLLAHEGVIAARILAPTIVQDGKKSFSVEITFKQRSRLPLFVTTLQGAELDVRVIVLPPRQCINCFRYGHESFNCRERGAICENCSDFRGDHAQPCYKMTRCANCCSRRHSSSSLRCCALYKSWRVHILGYTECLAFMEAKKLVDKEFMECLKRGGDYAEEFPLTSRYFLVVPADAFPGTHTATSKDKATDCVTCDYPQYRLGNEPGDSRILFATLDYYSTHDTPRGVQSSFVNVTQLCSPAYRTNWSSPTEFSQSEPRRTERNRRNEHGNYSPSSSPLHKSSLMSTNNADAISTDGEKKVIEPMLDVIDAKNRFTDTILYIDVLHNVNRPIGLVKFLATNLELVSRCWMDKLRYPPLKPNVSKVTADRSLVQRNDYEKDRYIKEWDADMTDCFTDKFSSHRCLKFLRGMRCDEMCMKIHRLPREDGVLCIHYQSSQCPFGRRCNFLHVSCEKSEQAFRCYTVKRNLFDHCDRDRLATRL